MNNLGTGKGDPSRRRQRPKGQRPTGLEIWNGFARGLDAVAHALTWFFRKAAAFLVRAAHLGAALSVHGLSVVRGLAPTVRALCLALAFVLALGAALSAAPVARLLNTQTVSLVEDGIAAQIRTQSRTVADVLTEYDIALGEGDVVYPALSTEIGGGDEIQIRRALEVSVSADGQTHTVSLLNGTVGKALYLAGVSIDPDDIVYPALTETVSSGMDITVNRVTITEEVEQQRIPYHITYQDSADLYIGEEEMVRQGTEGVKEVTYRVVTVDGEETERLPGDGRIDFVPFHIRSRCFSRLWLTRMDWRCFAAASPPRRPAPWPLSCCLRADPHLPHRGKPLAYPFIQPFPWRWRDPPL